MQSLYSIHFLIIEAPAQAVFFCFTRTCLKNHSRHLYAPLCVIVAPNSVNIAHYASFIRHKSPTNCDAHLTKSIFQICSRKLCLLISLGDMKCYFSDCRWRKCGKLYSYPHFFVGKSYGISVVNGVLHIFHNE